MIELLFEFLLYVAWIVVFFLLRCVLIVFATPIILLWPRHDPRLTWWQTVRKRYVDVLTTAFMPWRRG